MLEIKLSSPTVFQKIIDILHSLLQTFSFKFDQSGLTLTSLDSASVAFISLTLPSQFFTSYRCDTEISLSLGSENLHKVMSAVPRNNELTISSQNDAKTLIISYLDLNSHSNNSKIVRINTLESNEDEIGLSGLEFSSKIVMNSAEFADIMKSMVNISESLSINCFGNKCSFNSNSSINDIRCDYSNNQEDTEFFHIEGKEVSVKFTSKYLMKFSRMKDICRMVEINVGEAAPSVFTFNVDKGVEDEGGEDMEMGIEEDGSGKGGMGKIEFTLSPLSDDVEE